MKVIVKEQDIDTKVLTLLTYALVRRGLEVDTEYVLRTMNDFGIAYDIKETE